MLGTGQHFSHLMGATLKRPLEGVFSVPGVKSTLNEAVEGGTHKGRQRCPVKPLK